jgi:hypothetical protein
MPNFEADERTLLAKQQSTAFAIPHSVKAATLQALLTRLEHTALGSTQNTPLLLKESKLDALDRPPNP